MDFYARARMVCLAVPKGRVASYGQIALLCGAPNQARRVGYALGRGRLGEVPAHRVVNAAGFLSGAAAFETPGRQRELLLAEGVEVSLEGRVDLRRFAFKTTLEDALVFERLFKERGI